MIDHFEEEFDFLSNFYLSPFTVDGIVYPTVEHFFQAQKTLDKKARKTIAGAKGPGSAKRLGRTVSLRSDWEEIKDDVMRRALEIKFSDPALAQKLLDTGSEELVEGNWWHDNYWGSCSCKRCGFHGKNTLGKLLMEQRTKLRES